MAFHSILFETPEDGPPPGDVDEPDFFGNLNLDQVVRAVTDGFDEYDLAPFFRAELQREAAIRYRHDVMRDLERAAVVACLQSFSIAMREVRACLGQSETLYYPRQKQWWFMEAAAQYGLAVRALASGLRDAQPASSGLTGFIAYLANYVDSQTFVRLTREADAARMALAAVCYGIRIKGNAVTVLRYEGESDYSAHVLAIFDRFKQGEVKNHAVEIRDWPQMNHVEAKILDLVAGLEPEPFDLLTDFRLRHDGFIDRTVAAFDREIQFYVAYLRYIDVCRQAGLPFCYPDVSSASKAVRCEDTFDLALAHKRCLERSHVVLNGFALERGERIFVVSGPNNGGKTTFARTIGQLHFLAKIGCPVAGRNAALYLYDRLFAHFEREENTRDLRGKLQDDLMRMHRILSRTTSRSIVLMNEIFSSTTLADALFLSRKIIGEIVVRDALCVCVTFIEELAALGPQTVSMVSEADPADPAVRTFRIRRRPADGRAYAISVADRYGLHGRRLKERLAS